jgi:hypothetical protein
MLVELLLLNKFTKRFVPNSDQIHPDIPNLQVAKRIKQTTKHQSTINALRTQHKLPCLKIYSFSDWFYFINRLPNMLKSTVICFVWVVVMLITVCGSSPQVKRDICKDSSVPTSIINGHLIFGPNRQELLIEANLMNTTLSFQLDTGCAVRQAHLSYSYPILIRLTH